jgi:Tfp pilus assembly PilM family ATPase
MYTSTIDIGGANLSVALRAILGDVPESELTTIKNTQGLLRGFGDHRVYDALYTSVKSIADEINIRISYWNTKDIAHEHRQIQSLILCGGSVNMKGLPQYLTQTLGVRVEKANVWRNAFSIEDIIPPIDRRHSFGYATAVGLGITSFV